MAENKKGFVLYADQKIIFEDLTNEEAGLLIKHIFSYVNDENPILEDRLLNMAFKPIKLQLKRDLVKYKEVKEKRSLAGQRSSELKKQQVLTKSTSVENVEQALTKSTSVEDVEQVSTKSTVIDNVNVNVNVIDNVNVNVINIIDQYFKDFENGSHIVEMARTQKTTVEVLKAYIPHFKLKANTEYLSYAKFVDHFRNTWLLNKNKGNIDANFKPAKTFD